MKSTEASRQEIQNIWKDFPRFKAPKKTSVEKTEPKLLALGLELLKILEKDPGKNNDEKRALQLQIAQKYLESEQYGFARETALQLIAENNQDELAAQAEKIIFTIETLKLPETFNVKDKNALEILRWNIATYLVQTQLKLKDFAKIDELLNKEQLSWFSEAAKSILKIHFQSSNKM
jgi:hypothetical protein